MKTLLWLVDTRHPIPDASIEKLAYLSRTFGVELEIMLDKRVRSFERSYWLQFSGGKELVSNYRASQNQLGSYLARTLEDRDIAFKIEEIEDSSYFSRLKEKLNAESLLVIDDQPRAQRHPVFQQFSKLSASVLLLTPQAWHDPITIASAVDPLHEHARPTQLDHHIVSVTSAWRKPLQASLFLVHCCFTPPVFLEHRKTIMGIHRDGLNEFARKSNIPDEETVMLEGIPEHALPRWVKTHEIDILALGIVARSRLESFWVGSTTTALLDEPPCDMLLIKG